MKTLPTKPRGQRIFDELKPNPLWDLESMVQISSDDDDFDGDETKSYRLRSYVMYLDAETLQRYATIRSKESISLIEKQTQALFGRPDIRIADDGSLETPSDEVMGITFSGLMMLVLEAVAFGTFLWEAEGYVESKFHFLSKLSLSTELMLLEKVKMMTLAFPGMLSPHFIMLLYKFRS
ncbi:hypothetical protein GW17_00034393 [Ensete ventricosum]|nr:hypothetical protein GW17_00034393 [Ensete ventricosum]RZS26013.1 hypothetical protein BHM03_00059304 [Ensete ventricosum]